MNTSQDKGALLRMPSAKTAIKLDISTKCTRARKEPPREPTLFRAPRTMMIPTLMKMGVRQPNPPSRVNMLKVVNHIEANRGKFNEGKHLKFPIASHPKGPYNHHLMVRVDTGADVNCMNEKTFNEIFSRNTTFYMPPEIQNFRNSIADISILGQFILT